MWAADVQAMEQMGLVASANTRCGGTMAGGFEMKGLSGGEKRRLSIACVLLAFPAVIHHLQAVKSLFKLCFLMCTLHSLRATQGSVSWLQQLASSEILGKAHTM